MVCCGRAVTPWGCVLASRDTRPNAAQAPGAAKEVA
jgi:hypothetical protein